MTEARAVGLTGDYARAMASAGVPLDLDDYVQLRAMGISPGYVLGLAGPAIQRSIPDKIIQMWSVGVRPADLSVAPRPPKPPNCRRDRTPAASPPNWGDPDGG